MLVERYKEMSGNVKVRGPFQGCCMTPHVDALADGMQKVTINKWIEEVIDCGHPIQEMIVNTDCSCYFFGFLAWLRYETLKSAIRNSFTEYLIKDSAHCKDEPASESIQL